MLSRAASSLFWLELKELREKGVSESNASRVFDWTRERSHVFRGAAYGTLLRNDAFHFLRLGTFIERADTTARVLDIRHRMATSSLDGHATQSFFEWTALLHSLAAFEAYQNTYGHNIEPMNVAELLILKPDVPRSLHACLEEIAGLLEQIESGTARRARRLATGLDYLDAAPVRGVRSGGGMEHLHTRAWVTMAPENQ